MPDGSRSWGWAVDKKGVRGPALGGLRGNARGQFATLRTSSFVFSAVSKTLLPPTLFCPSRDMFLGSREDTGAELLGGEEFVG